MTHANRLLDRLAAELLAMTDNEVLAERRPLIRQEAAGVIGRALADADAPQGCLPHPAPGAAVPRDPG